MNQTKKVEISTFKQIKSLLKVIISSLSREYETISKRYYAESSNYNETENLLIELGIISKIDQIININNEFEEQLNLRINDDEFLKGYLIKRIFNSKNIYSDEIFCYLNNFSLGTDNRFTFYPSTEENIQFSSIRNFL